MCNLVCNEAETSYAFRFFETGKRRTWTGARQAILDVNRTMQMLPLKNKKWRRLASLLAVADGAILHLAGLFKALSLHHQRG